MTVPTWLSSPTNSGTDDYSLRQEEEYTRRVLEDYESETEKKDLMSTEIESEDEKRQRRFELAPSVPDDAKDGEESDHPDGGDDQTPIGGDDETRICDDDAQTRFTGEDETRFPGDDETLMTRTVDTMSSEEDEGRRKTQEEHDKEERIIKAMVDVETLRLAMRDIDAARDSLGLTEGLSSAAASSPDIDMPDSNKLSYILHKVHDMLSATVDQHDAVINTYSKDIRAERSLFWRSVRRGQDVLSAILTSFLNLTATLGRAAGISTFTTAAETTHLSPDTQIKDVYTLDDPPIQALWGPSPLTSLKNDRLLYDSIRVSSGLPDFGSTHRSILGAMAAMDAIGSADRKPFDAEAHLRRMVGVAAEKRFRYLDELDQMDWEVEKERMALERAPPAEGRGSEEGSSETDSQRSGLIGREHEVWSDREFENRRLRQKGRPCQSREEVESALRLTEGNYEAAKGALLSLQA